MKNDINLTEADLKELQNTMKDIVTKHMWEVQEGLVFVEKFFELIKQIPIIIKENYLDTWIICQQRYNAIARFSNKDIADVFSWYIKRDIKPFETVIKRKCLSWAKNYIQSKYLKGFVIIDIDSALNKLREQYPLVPEWQFQKLQQPKTYNIIKEQTLQQIDDYSSEWDMTIEAIMADKKKNNPQINQETNILLSSVEVFLYAACQQNFVNTILVAKRREYAHNTLSDIQEKKEKKEKIKSQNIQNKQSIQPQKQTTITKPKHPTKNQLTKEHQRMLAELEEKLKDKVEIDIDYLTRMLKKDGSIHLDRLLAEIKEKSEQYKNNIEQIVLQILTDYNYANNIVLTEEQETQLQEMIQGKQDAVDEGNIWEDTEDSLWEDTEDSLWEDTEVSDEDTTDTSDQNSTLQLSPTLRQYKQNPGKLDAIWLITILKELWYKIYDQEKFDKEVEKLFKDKVQGDKLKADIIESLQRPRHQLWSRRKAFNGVPYQRVKLVYFHYRLVKQWNTIIRLTDYKNYKKRVQHCFTEKKINYSNAT